MTKKIQNQILYNLHFLKSCGYQYISDVNLKENKSDTFDLPNDLNLLSNIVSECSLCALSKTRRNTIFGTGNINSNIMIIGDFPSISEDESGTILSGKYGQMLQSIVTNVLKMRIEDVYFTNIFKCKKSNFEIEQTFHQNCISYLFKQMELVKPRLIVLLGNDTYKYFFNKSDEDMNIIHGQFEEYNGIKVISTYHPSFLVRNPSYKKDVMNHMLKVKSYLEN